MEEKRYQSNQYYSCQCIRMIVGRIKNDMIHTGLASRLRKFLSITFDVDDNEMSEIIADFYWKKNRNVNPEDFVELISIIYKKNKPIIKIEGELWDEAARIISAFEDFGWGVNQFKEMYSAGIPHVERLIKKKGCIW